MTPLDRPIKRSLTVDGTAYTITVSPTGVHITQKGHRRGHQITWQDLLTGEAELVSQLHRSLAPDSAAETRPGRSTTSTS